MTDVRDHVGHANVDCGRDGRRLLAKFVVEFAGDREGRSTNASEALPQPILGPRATASKRLGETVRVSTTRIAFDGVDGQVGEEWLGEPFVEKGLGPDDFDAIRQRFVLTTAVSAQRLIGDASRCAQQHEASDQGGMAQGDVECHPSAKGVPPQVAGAVEDFGDEIGAFVERCVYGGGLAVTWQVECPEFSRLCQNGTEPGRGSTGLGKAV